MVRCLFFALCLSACAIDVDAKVECLKERFEFKGMLSDLSIFRFEQENGDELSVSLAELEVYRVAKICGKSSPNICLNVGGEIGTLFLIPKTVLVKNEKKKEWSGGKFLFKLKFNDMDIYIVESYLKKYPEIKRFSFYYSAMFGLLAIILHDEKYGDEVEFKISDVFVSTCPGFLSFDQFG